MIKKHNNKLPLSPHEKKVVNLFDNFAITDVTFDDTNITFVIKFDSNSPFNPFLNNRTFIAIYDEQSRQMILSKISITTQKIGIDSGQLWYPCGMNKYKCKDTKCERCLLEYLHFLPLLFQLSRRDSLTVNCQLSTVNFTVSCLLS